MALTVAHNTLREKTNYSREQYGNLAFTTTALTGELPSSVESIEDIQLGIIGPPGTCTREIAVNLGTLSATGEALIVTPPYAGTLVSALLVVKTTVSTDDTNYWTFALANESNSAAAMLLATDAVTTKATGGSALTAYTPRSLGLNGTAANLAFTANNCLHFTATKTASGANLVNASLLLNFNVGDLGEYVYVDEAAQVSGGLLARPATNTLTITRGGTTVTSALKVGYRFRGR